MPDISSLSLIINADDFGKSESVNQAVAEVFRRGWITNTTLMVNMPYADQAVQLAQEEGFWDRVGLHLNLTEGQLFNTDFLNGKIELKNVLLKKTLPRFILPGDLGMQIRKEITLQIEKFFSYCPTCLHVDSHHHVHTFPSVWRQCKPLLRKYQISSVRLSRNLYTCNTYRLKKVYKQFYNHDVVTSGFSGSVWFGSFEDFLNVIPHHASLFHDGDVIELMSHPDYENGELINNGAVGFHVMEKYYQECKLLHF